MEGGRRVLRQVNNTDPTKLPLKLKFTYISGYRPRKKCQKEPVNGFGLDFYICYYEFPSNQGQFTEVPLSFEIFAIKVVGESI